MTQISTEGVESHIDTVFVRGSKIQFIILPSMLQHAPFFSRIKMWRKFKGNAVFGAAAQKTDASSSARSQGGQHSAAIMQKHGGGFGGDRNNNSQFRGGPGGNDRNSQRGGPAGGGGNIYGPGDGNSYGGRR